MSLTFAFDKEITGKASGKPFPKWGHAYLMEITAVEKNSNGFVNIHLTSDEVQTDEYTALSWHENDKFIIDNIYKLANNVVRSNEAMKGAVGKNDMDISKWANKGLKVGVVFKNKKEKNKETGEYEMSKFIRPYFSIGADDVESWEVDEAGYNAFMAEFWPNSGETSESPKSEPKASAKLDDNSMDLPF